MSRSPGSPWGRLPTESANPRSRHLDRMGVAAVVALMQSEDRRVLAALAAAKRTIGLAAGAFRDAYRSGGRCLLFGAGTSGRLAVLEAAELPPTFGTDPRRIRAFAAGGRAAVFRSREGAEDRLAEGTRQASIARPGDLVIGVSASSVTPYVRGALGRARERGATTVLLTASGAKGLRGVADIVVALAVGPEVVAGSTRLKAGTATKLALNQITTAALATSGGVYGPWMVELSLGSAKLRDRAVRTLAAAVPTTPAMASRLIARAGGSVKAAIFMGKTGANRRLAQDALARAGGNLRAALAARSREGGRKGRPYTDKG